MNILAVAVADYIGLVLLIALLYSSHIRRSGKEFEYRIFTMMAVGAGVACVVDFFTFYCDGKAGFVYRAVNLYGTTFCFIMNPLFSLGWCLYTEMKLYKSKARIRRRYKYLGIPGILLAILAVVNTFVPVIFYVDESGLYHRMPLSYVYYVVELFYLLYSYFIYKLYEAQYEKPSFFPIGLMIGPVFTGCVLQLVFYGISLAWVSVAVGLTSIYMSLQNEFSYLDKLTGLYNRAYLDYILERYAKDSDNQMGGIMIDVDYFKKINDSFGHSVGDEALIDTARVIALSKPDKATAIRFAGDEFIIILKGSTDESMRKIIQSIRNEQDLFNETEGRQYKLSLSIGYTLFDPEKDSVDSFFKHMDDNMYEEKNRKHAEGK